MTLADELLLAEIDQKAAVMRETWDHLFPKRGVRYPCMILFSWCESHEVAIIKSDFGKLPGSPVQYMDTNEFIGKAAKVQGQVYRFTGDYVTYKNGKFCFSGKIKWVRI